MAAATAEPSGKGKWNVHMRRETPSFVLDRSESEGSALQFKNKRDCLLGRMNNLNNTVEPSLSGHQFFQVIKA